MTLSPIQVMPAELGRVVAPIPYWFVIGGQAVRCFCPYRPSRDVDFGVKEAMQLDDLLAQLQKSGSLEIIERSEDTVHVRWNDIDVSIFVLDNLLPFVEDRRLNLTGILATKLHAIVDRGTRRDFFDMYITLQIHRVGIAECLGAIRLVHKENINDGLLLRALTYFDDADKEAALPGEGPTDWATVKDFFVSRVGQLLIAPSRVLAIQKLTVDVSP